MIKTTEGMKTTVYPDRAYGYVVIYSPARKGDMRLCVMKMTGQQMLDAWATPEIAGTTKLKVLEDMALAYEEVIRTGEFPESLITLFIAHLWHLGPPPEEAHTIIVRVGPVKGVPSDLLIGGTVTPLTLEQVMAKKDWTNVVAGWVERGLREAHGVTS